MFPMLHLWWYNHQSQSVNWNSMYWVHRPGCANDQVHIISKEAQMTILNANWHISWEFDSKLIVTPGVVNEIPKSYEAMTNSAKTESPFPYAKAISHSETLLVAPTAFPKLASAALHHAWKNPHNEELPHWQTRVWSTAWQGQAPEVRNGLDWRTASHPWAVGNYRGDPGTGI